MTPLYIFDLDGTLADLKHRRHFVERPRCEGCIEVQNHNPCGNCMALYEDWNPANWKPNWDAFHAACVNDKPIQPVIETLLRLMKSGATIWIWSGRIDTVRAQTVEWIADNITEHAVEFRHWTPVDLKMRPAGDYTFDDQLKESWLHAMSPEDRARLVMVFDDRTRVVNMWRRNGVVCAQVAPGDF